MAAERPAGPEPRISMRVEWVAGMTGEIGAGGGGAQPICRCPGALLEGRRGVWTMPHDNPLGLDGFEFVEFTSPDPEALADLFRRLGFAHRSDHRTKRVRHYAQGDINFLLNMEPTGHAEDFRGAHGPSASAMAFRVMDAQAALAMAVERGATAVEGEYGLPAIEGIGGS